mmetsp:Transcript_30030/g.92970  ORF Transcript_30030/g.92970 Transcript_30030/m.92970 type:complete len:90 (-) Transcript_30030:184-453(-)
MTCSSRSDEKGRPMQTKDSESGLELQKMTELALRRGRTASVAMIAKRAAQYECERNTNVLLSLMEESQRLQVQAGAMRAIIHVHNSRCK